MLMLEILAGFFFMIFCYVFIGLCVFALILVIITAFCMVWDKSVLLILSPLIIAIILSVLSSLLS